LRAMSVAESAALVEGTPDVIKQLFDCIKEHTEIDDY